MSKKLVRPVLSFLLLLLVYFALFHFVIPRKLDTTEKPDLYTAQFTDETRDGCPEGTQGIRLTGASLYRVNYFYLNGKRVSLRYYQAVSFSEGLAFIDRAELDRDTEWTVAVGKGGLLTCGEVYRSNEVPLEK